MRCFAAYLILDPGSVAFLRERLGLPSTEGCGCLRPGNERRNTLRALGEKLPMAVPLEVHRRALQTSIEQIGGV